MKTLAWLRGVTACLAVLSLTACEEVDGPLGPDYGEDTGGIGGNPPPGTPGTPGNPDDDDDEPVDPGPVDPGPVDPGPVDPGPVDPGTPGDCVSPDLSNLTVRNLLTTCRVCHNSANGALAGDTEFVLNTPATYPQAVRAAYKALGVRLLDYPASKEHTSAQPLAQPKDYNAWKTVVDTLGQPNACP